MWLQPDISHWQGHHTREDMVQAATVASSIMFKATQGNGFIDPEFRSNVEAANGANLPWGAYHFVDTVEEGFGEQQARHFWNVASSLRGLTFLCIDWERAGRKLVLELSDTLRELATVPVGDYIGSHARANGGQLPNMSFHMVPQYGPAELDPRYATEPLSAWQYTNGEFNGTDWPSGVPGIGKCDMSAVYRPGDFGFGGDMPLSDQDKQDIADLTVKTLRKSELRSTDHLLVEQAWRDANVTRSMMATLTADVANWDDNLLAGLRQALVEELAKIETGEVSADEIASAVLQKYIEKLST